MSNLNVNNIDVQRMINVFKELQWKIDLCSCLTMNTFEKIKSKEDQIESEFGERVLFLLKDHYDKMNQFRNNHLIYKEEKKEIERSDEDNYLEVEEEGPKEITKEKQNLNEIEENTSEFTKALAKSTRNLFRELKGNLKLLSFLKELRGDPDIIKFADDMTTMIINDISRSKMTEEEEISERELNEKLINKIRDMENQLSEKNSKLKKLTEDKKNYKDTCLEKLDNIKKEIQGYKDSTKNFLDGLENDINDSLNNYNKQHLAEIDELSKEFGAKQKEFKEEKEKNLKEEKIHSDNLFKAETDLIAHLKDFYDNPLENNKRMYEEKQKEEMEKANEIAELSIKLQRMKDKTDVYEKAHKEFMEKKSNMENERRMLVYACGNIQSAFRGFFSRKTLKKKYKKILAPLIKVKPNMNPDQGKNNKNPKKK